MAMQRRNSIYKLARSASKSTVCIRTLTASRTASGDQASFLAFLALLDRL